MTGLALSLVISSLPVVEYAEGPQLAQISISIARSPLEVFNKGNADVFVSFYADDVDLA